MIKQIEIDPIYLNPQLIGRGAYGAVVKHPQKVARTEIHKKV